MSAVVFWCRLFFSSIFLSSWRFFRYTSSIFVPWPAILQFISVIHCFIWSLFFLNISSMVFVCLMFSIAKRFVSKVKSRICSRWSSTNCESFRLFSSLSWNFCCNSVIPSWQTDSSVSAANSEENVISKWSSTPASKWSMRWTLLSYKQTNRINYLLRWTLTTVYRCKVQAFVRSPQVSVEWKETQYS